MEGWRSGGSETRKWSFFVFFRVLGVDLDPPKIGPSAIYYIAGRGIGVVLMVIFEVLWCF